MQFDFASPAFQEMLKANYERQFPNLAQSNAYRVTSPANQVYNCIGWAATKKTKSWWWPDRYWPNGVKKLVTVEEFLNAFGARGFKDLSDASFEPKLEKIALYCLGDTPKHAARQVRGDIWTSKMGQSQDIEHRLSDLEGGPYGAVTHYLSRRRRA